MCIIMYPNVLYSKTERHTLLLAILYYFEWRLYIISTIFSGFSPDIKTCICAHILGRGSILLNKKCLRKQESLLIHNYMSPDALQEKIMQAYMKSGLRRNRKKSVVAKLAKEKKKHFVRCVLCRLAKMDKKTFLLHIWNAK